MEGDKRVHSRFKFSEPVAYSHPQVTVSGSVAGNISLGGISLKVQGFVPMGAVLEMQIRLGKSPKVVWAKGQVVRMRKVMSDECYEIGLKFVQDEQCMKAVGEYINAYRTKITI